MNEFTTRWRFTWPFLQVRSCAKCDVGFIEQECPKLVWKQAPELPTELMGLLGSVFQQPDSGTVAKQQKERAMYRHNGTQKTDITHKKKKKIPML